MSFKDIVQVSCSSVGQFLPFLQAALFEMRIGQGKCVFFTLNLHEDDLAAMYLKHCVLRYMESDQFQPAVSTTLEYILRLLERRVDLELDFDEETHSDGNISLIM